MRRRHPVSFAAPVAAVLALGLVLSACAGSTGGSTSSSANPSASASASGSPDAQATTAPAVPVVESADGMPTATGKFGEKPELTFPDKAEALSSEVRVQVLEEGTGEVVESGDLLLANYLGQIWGGKVFDNSYDRGAPAGFPIGVGEVITGWDTSLVGRTLGSRLLVSIPPKAGYEGGNPNAGIGAEDIIVFVVDLVGSYGADAAGDPKATPGKPLPADGPQVSGELGAKPVITIPKGAKAPTKTSVHVVATGTGDKPKSGSLIVQYAIANYDGAPGFSTWEQGAPQQLDVINQAPVLIGISELPVGSRALVQVPAEGENPAYAVVIDIVAG